MKKLPESEQEIMMIVWEYAEPVSRFQIEEKLNVEKNIAPSTILTLLTRLEKKGFIQKVRNGKSNLYVPLVEKENYIGTVGKNMLDKMFQGSLAKFASSLYDGENLAQKRLSNCRNLLTDKNRKSGVEDIVTDGIYHKVESFHRHNRIYGICCTKNNGEKTRSLLEKGSLDTSDN